ncbi:MAG: hypothetical protein ACRBK7_08685 [Acidimicrobiales bacterium]
MELLDRDGLKLGTDSISYTKVFGYLEAEYGVKVTRASVHERIWPNHDAFREDVLAAAVGQMPTTLPIDYAAIDSLLDSAESEKLDTYEAMGRLANQIGNHLLLETREQPHFEQLLSAKAIAIKTDAAPAESPLQDRLNRQSQEFLGTKARFPVLMERLGLHPRNGATSEEVVAAIRSSCALMLVGGHLNYGAGSNDIADPVSIKIAPGADSAAWPILSVGLMALFDLFYEPDGQPIASGPLTFPEPEAQEPAANLGPKSESSTTRRSREELKELVLAAGVELLLQRPIELRPESLGYSAVLGHLQEQHDLTVHRSAIHNRIWATSDDFWIEVLTHATGIDTDMHSPVVQAGLDLANSSDLDPVGRQQAALDALRQLANTHFEIGISSPDYLRRLLIKATLLRTPPSRDTDALRAAVNDADSQRTVRAKALIEATVDGLGFEVKPNMGLTKGHAAAIVAELSTAALVGAVFDDLAGVKAAVQSYKFARLDDPSRSDLWTPAAITMQASFMFLFQLAEQ